MLDIAKDRFKTQDNVAFLHQDYVKDLPDKKYDIVISALSLHHIEKEQKEILYDKLQSHINNGGWFISYDQFKMNDEKIEKDCGRRLVQFHKRVWNCRKQFSLDAGKA